MSLRSKIILVLACVVTLYAGIDQMIQRAIIGPEFEDFELVEARKDIERVIRALDREVEELSARCRDWARWDETCAFVEEYDPETGDGSEFVRSNLGAEALADASIHLLYICAPDGRVVWGRITDPDTGQPLTLREFPADSLAPGRGLMHHRDLHDHNSGVILPEDRPMLVSSRPIVTSRGEGPTRGVVVIGRFLSGAIVASLENRTEVDFDHWPLFSPDLPAQELAIRDEVTASAEPVHVERSDELLHLYATVDDINAAPALLVRANFPRQIFARGRTSMRYAFLSTIAAGLLLLLVLLGLLQRIVLAPIAQLTSHALAVGRTDDTFSRLDSEREDEIGILSREFDGMLQKLSASRAAVVDTARKAGMSEIATGVLHNVGNVLNSINVSASVVAKKARSSALDDLQRVVDVLDDHAEDLADFVTTDPRGKHLHPFLRSLADKLAADREELKREIKNLGDGIDHVKVLVKAQQSFARKAKVLEPTDLVEQVEMALSMSFQVLPDRGDLEVVRRFEELPRVVVDRHRLMEILVNVILNARQAIDEAGGERKHLELTIRRAGESVEIAVADNGTGIPEENLTKIFHHGFTTKPDGYGFGLHTAANSATEMNGSLHAVSDGPGRGATFVLTFPFQVVRSKEREREAQAA